MSTNVLPNLRPIIDLSKQKYSKKKLLAFDSLTGMLEVDTFFVPSCCVCQLMRVVEPDEPASSLADENDPSS